MKQVVGYFGNPLVRRPIYFPEFSRILVEMMRKW